MARILLVEDDVSLAEAISDWLGPDMHVVEKTETGEAAIQLLDNCSYDLIVLDWKLPGQDGLSVLQQARASGIKSPVLFLTGRANVESIELALDTGADDYLPKPFSLRELASRIGALLRRPTHLLPQSAVFDHLKIDLENHAVFLDGKRVFLSKREFALLEFFVRHPNSCFSARSLLCQVWPANNSYTDATVRVTMINLRRKITLPGNSCVIKTIAGSGYILESAA